jgi:hypothetical protein
VGSQATRPIFDTDSHGSDSIVAGDSAAIRGPERATRYETRATVKTRKTDLDMPSPYSHNRYLLGRLAAAPQETKGDARGRCEIEDAEEMHLTPLIVYGHAE